MSVKGFNTENGVEKYDFHSLDNIPENLVIPDYVVEEAERVSKSVLSVQGYNTFTSIMMSDLHNDDLSNSIERGLKHASLGAYLISHMVNIDLHCFLGDYIAGYSESKEVAINQFFEIHKFVSPYLQGKEQVWLQGNHDMIPKGVNGELTISQMFSLIGKHSSNVARPTDETERGYFYKDIDKLKLRIICLNTSDIKGINIDTSKDESFNLHRVSSKQLEWFCQSLDISSTKEDSKDWKIWILSHHPVDWGVKRSVNEYYVDEDGVKWTTDIKVVYNVIKAYLAGNVVDISLDNTKISYDFSGKNLSTIICNTHGHVHNYSQGVLGDTNIIRFGVPNACIGRENTKAYTDYVQEVDYTKEENTGQDTSFVVVTLDLDKKLFYIHHYGAGIDRILSYGKSTGIYSITRILTNCHSTSSISSIEELSSLTETFIPDSGYTIETATVAISMGGVDITSSCYSDGMLSISEVTGDIIITCNAGLLNQIPLSTDESGGIFNDIGYRVDVRMNSSGSVVNAEGYMATGFIPFSIGKTLQTFGTTTNTLLNDTYCYLCFYDENKDIIKAVAIAESNVKSLGMEVSEDGYLTFKLSSGFSSSIYANTKFIRMSANIRTGNGSDFIISVV